LDIGCASGILLDAWSAGRFGPKVYLGVDLSEMMVAAAREKYPRERFLVGDPFISPEVWRRAPDYVVMGGIFTWRPSVSREAMLEYFRALIRRAFDECRVGVSFNLISKHVDWEREDLFHMPFDELARLLRKELSSNYVFRADYGLREFTAYVYK
jgi:SAM-dependent methyltransferase